MSMSVPFIWPEVEWQEDWGLYPLGTLIHANWNQTILPATWSSTVASLELPDRAFPGRQA